MDNPAWKLLAVKTDHPLYHPLQQARERTEATLEKTLPGGDTLPGRLHEAMRYSAMAGGKRVRPLLVYATGAALQVDKTVLDAPACAVELIHAYSLIHDDLPAMDDDDLRRGQPTCHKAYDEATAILAGDALQTQAFYLLSRSNDDTIPADRRLRMIEILAQASGSRGMCGGQSIDLDSVGREISLAELEMMHIHKTGALIRASVMMGALCADAIEEKALKSLDHYAKCIGLAFQIHDDILDVEGTTDKLGKASGADQALNKPTYTSLMGLEGARQKARELIDDALDSLGEFGTNADTLRHIAGYMIERSH